MKQHVYTQQELEKSNALSDAKAAGITKIEKAIDQDFSTPNKAGLRSSFRICGKKLDLTNVDSLTKFNSILGTALFPDSTKSTSTTASSQSDKNNLAEKRIELVSSYLRSPCWMAVIKQCLLREIRHSVVMKDGEKEIAIDVRDGFNYIIELLYFFDNTKTLQFEITINVLWFTTDGGYFGIKPGFLTNKKAAASLLKEDLQRTNQTSLQFKAGIALEIKDDVAEITFLKLEMFGFVDNIEIKPGINFKKKVQRQETIRQHRDSSKFKEQKAIEEQRQAEANQRFESMTDEEFRKAFPLLQPTERSSSSSSASFTSVRSSSPPPASFTNSAPLLPPSSNTVATREASSASFISVPSSSPPPRSAMNSAPLSSPSPNAAQSESSGSSSSARVISALSFSSSPMTISTANSATVAGYPSSNMAASRPVAPSPSHRAASFSSSPINPIPAGALFPLDLDIEQLVRGSSEVLLPNIASATPDAGAMSSGSMLRPSLSTVSVSSQPSTPNKITSLSQAGSPNSNLVRAQSANPSYQSPSPRGKKSSSRVASIEDSPITWRYKTGGGSSVVCTEQGLQNSVAVTEWQNTPFKGAQAFTVDSFNDLDITVNGKKIDETILPQSRAQLKTALFGENNPPDAEQQIEEKMQQQFQEETKRLLFGETMPSPETTAQACKYIQNSAAMIENLVIRKARYSVALKSEQDGKENLPIFPRRFYKYKISWNLDQEHGLVLRAKITVEIFSMIVGKDSYVLDNNEDGSKSAKLITDENRNKEKPVLLEIHVDISSDLVSVPAPSSASTSSTVSVVERQSPRKLKVHSITFSTNANNLVIYPEENKARLQAQRALFKDIKDKQEQAVVRQPSSSSASSSSSQKQGGQRQDIDDLFLTDEERAERIQRAQRQAEQQRQRQLAEEQAKEQLIKQRQQEAEELRRLYEGIAEREEKLMAARNNSGNDDDDDVGTTPSNVVAPAAASTPSDQQPTSPSTDVLRIFDNHWHGYEMEHEEENEDESVTGSEDDAEADDGLIKRASSWLSGKFN